MEGSKSKWKSIRDRYVRGDEEGERQEKRRCWPTLQALLAPFLNVDVSV